MRKLLNVLILIGVLSSIGGCTYKKPTLVDFIGIWKSSTGGEIILQEDSICVIKNIIYSGYLCTEMLSYKGKWEFRDKDDLGNKQYNIIISKEGVLFMCFYISGEGLFNNTPPWYLFQYIGDPDELNLYKFTKLKYNQANW
ncbi:hypothetical protein KSZ28_05820 [Bacteroides salyersiae]|jgi:hypothetical protein|uniref:hypothetical protein n=1 Tax=Bacteroides salyersiae TaxID=291644 RepID=UPI000326F422|nr:hypothetical protein [Bacteroides salyersiae]EOA51788.1 hypothetical protein HMPREF1532_00150 [Bacteroides salyersiae WAL 10018 = DSM 18765 = JCM 12988]MBV4203231.1 hypothetical protein [Bacteroides salyersiae]MCB6648419.1 hypothetical protein [Bacteroides salyersiae]MCS3059900.1 hypothetical protein [Bacteroides salyersiae]